MVTATRPWEWGLIFGFFVGVAAASLLPLGWSVALLGWWLGIVFFTWYQLASRRPKIFLVLAVFFLALGAGIGRTQQAVQPPDPRLEAAVGQEINLRGVINGEPDVRENGLRLTVALANRQAILVSASRYPAFSYGDEVELTGRLERPQNFTTEAGHTFDNVNYLAKDSIRYQMFQPQVTFVSSGHGSRLLTALFRLKNTFLDRLAQAIPEPHAALLGGLVVGAKRALPLAWQEAFRAVGLSHIVVLSGYNITVVAENIVRALRVLRFLPSAAPLWGGGAAVILFTLMTGAASTAIRAAIMALLALLARASGRLYASGRALTLAALLMVFFKPTLLVFDLSFQLSFLATLGVIFGPPRLARYFYFLPARWGFRDMALTTISAQLLVLPWLVYKMGQLSLVALPLNLLVLGFIPVTMLLGFLTGLVGLASPILSLPFAYATYVFLAYDLAAVKLFSRLPFAAVRINHLPLVLVLVVYLAYMIWYWYLRLWPVAAKLPGSLS